MNRRGFLRLGLAALAAPAIIRASNLMAVKPWPDLILIDDPRYAEIANLYARHLAQAMVMTRENLAAEIFSNRMYGANLPDGFKDLLS